VTQGADYGIFEVGSVTQPLDPASRLSLLHDADPALYFYIDFLVAMLSRYVAPRFMAAVNAANLTQITDIVSGSAFPYEPMPLMLDQQLKCPALFVYRTTAHTEQWTVAADHDICGINVVFVLPPIDSAGTEQLQPILKAVYDCIRRKTNDCWDPSYTPPGGALGQMFTQLVNIEVIRFGPPIDRRVAGAGGGNHDYGHLPGVGDLWFPMLLMRGYITEKDTYNPTAGGPSKFLGADITGNVVADDGTKVPATSTTVVQASTTFPPTIAALTATTGPATGGTPVTIEGTGFQPGPPMVFFGPANDPQYAVSVTYQSADLLAVVTPPMQGAGIVDITVVNRDGQKATLPQSFTFT
jgi:hypothetical protein